MKGVTCVGPQSNNFPWWQLKPYLQGIYVWVLEARKKIGMARKLQRKQLIKKKLGFDADMLYANLGN